MDLCQALLGAWAGPAAAGLTERMTEFLLKAARENKQQTSWVDQDEGYEAGLTDFAERALSDQPFKAAFDTAAAPFIRIGERKSLVQLGLKLFAPGIPDIYQGTEFVDLSLVDPDNRRPVDFTWRLECLEGGFEGITAFDRRRMELLSFGLKARRLWPDIVRADYRARPADAGVIVFSREHKGRALHLVAALSGMAPTPPIEVEGKVITAYPPAGEDLGISIAIVCAEV